MNSEEFYFGGILTFGGFVIYLVGSLFTGATRVVPRVVVKGLGGRMVCALDKEVLV